MKTSIVEHNRMLKLPLLNLNKIFKSLKSYTMTTQLEINPEKNILVPLILKSKIKKYLVNIYAIMNQ